VKNLQSLVELALKSTTEEYGYGCDHVVTAVELFIRLVQLHFALFAFYSP
jgi:hypothetical protein